MRASAGSRVRAARPDVLRSIARCPGSVDGRTGNHPCKWSVPRVLSLAVGLGLSLIGPSARAQQAAPPRLQLPAPAQPRPGPPVVVPQLPGQAPEITVTPLRGAAPPGAERIKVVLRDIVIEGLTAYRPEQLRPIYADLLGKEIPLIQVFDVAQRIQDKYRADGYILARIVVPEQTIRNGVFRLQVIEGFISSVRVEGDIGPVRQRIAAYLNRVKDMRPVREQDLERYLLLATDIPGIQAFGVLQRGQGGLGAAELVVKATRKPFQGFALADNRGSKFTGPWRGGVDLQENSATGFGERAEVYLFTTEASEQRYAQLTYEQALGSEGIRLLLYAAYGPSEPDFTLQPLNVRTEVRTANISLSYPLIRSRKRNLYLEGGFQAISSKVDVFDRPFTRDNLRVLFARATYDFDSPFGGRSLIGGGIRQGLPWLGASDSNDPDVSRLGARSDATVLTALGAHYQPVTDRLGVQFSATGQYAFDKVLSDEEFRIGGEACGRGYDPSEVAGDNGACLSTELRYARPISLGPLRSYQAYGFYDVGAVWLKDSSDDSLSLASAGIGVRTQWLDHVFLNLELAKPLTRVPATRSDKDPHLYVNLIARF